MAFVDSGSRVRGPFLGLVAGNGIGASLMLFRPGTLRHQAGTDVVTGGTLWPTRGLAASRFTVPGKLPGAALRC